MLLNITLYNIADFLAYKKYYKNVIEYFWGIIILISWKVFFFFLFLSNFFFLVLLPRALSNFYCFSDLHIIQKSKFAVSGGQLAWNTWWQWYTIMSAFCESKRYYDFKNICNIVLSFGLFTFYKYITWTQTTNITVWYRNSFLLTFI